MKNRSAFPYRRPGNKVRPKQGGGRWSRDGHRGSGTAQEILSQLQPTTKALAQMLAGNTKASGQLAHARNMLSRAQRLVDDRLTDRLRPGDREEYMELLARLKLTLSDAEQLVDEEKPQESGAVAEKPPIDQERLRALALSIAASTQVKDEPEPTGPSLPDLPDIDESVAVGSQPADEDARRASEPDNNNAIDANSPDKGDRRQKLRLKPIKRDDDGIAAKA